jgi:GTPase
MFVDELTIKAYAGRGGNGVVRWRHLKGKELSGPSGGDGGRGGDVYLRCVQDIARLARYRHKKIFKAAPGAPGETESRHGKNGANCVIEVPRGSVITHRETKVRYELLTVGEEVRILKGGAGGYGNEHFKGALNRAPQESTAGKPGASGTFAIELELVVDVGIVGMPNAGKSSLLNALTRASSKVAGYAFTTLTPHLGVFQGRVFADIPGIIEGASEGKGLGHAFLRHIMRTKMILHCVSLEHEDVLGAYRTVRAELVSYGRGLSEKPEVVLLTKRDLVVQERLKEVVSQFASLKKPVLSVSVHDSIHRAQFVKELRAFLSSQAQMLESPQPSP